MRNRKGQPQFGICIRCGTIVTKRLGIPLRLTRCPKSGLYTVVKYRKNLNDFHITKRTK